MTDLSKELAFARDAAELGGRLAMGHFPRPGAEGLKREQKKDGTWVTEADWAVEAQIRLRISRTWPDHNILGEEEGLTSAGGGEPIAGAPTWVLDPIDGTHNYMAGIPVWATLVGLQIDGRSVVGAAHAPALGETYWGAIGHGAFMNGAAIQVNAEMSLADATVVHAGDKQFTEIGLKDFRDEIMDRAWRTRGFADFWGHMLVARGAVHVMIEPELSLWDVAALEPIVTEAGGRLTHLDGTPWAGHGSCLTTNGTLHEEIVELVRQTAPGWTEAREAPGAVPQEL